MSLAARDRFVTAVWSAATKAGPSDIYAAVSTDGGATFTAPSGEVGVYPAAASTGGGAVIAWTNGPPDASVIKIARFP